MTTHLVGSPFWKFVSVNPRKNWLKRIAGLPESKPASEASKNMPVLFGLTTRACWSGWIPFGAYGVGSQQEPAGAGSVVASHVMSVNFSPAFVDRSTARPFERKPYSPY